MQRLEEIVHVAASIVWGPPTVLLLLGIGVYLSLRLRFVPLRYLPLSLRLLGNRDYGERSAAREGDISPVRALTVSLATTVGNGNIAGVCTAIAVGGPGAVFWMWISALFGMATKLVEAVLGQRFRVTTPDGLMAGGPMYYISRGLGFGRLAGLFAFVMGCKVLISTSVVQSNSIAVALKSQMGITPLVTGVGMALLTWLVIIGGIRSIAQVTVLLSPLMIALYLLGAVTTLALYAHRIPHALSLIFVGAFDPSALGGGMAGVTVAAAMRYGLARGAYSNEAGTGTAGVFHAPAQTSSPVRQGLLASLDVFLDTMVICSLTAFTVLVTGAWTEGTSTEMTVRAFNAAVPWFGGLIVALSSLLFGFSSLVAAPYYGETALTYLFGAHIKVPFRWAFCVLILAGSLVEVEFAWSLGDVLNGLMTVSNLVGLIGLSGVAVGAVKGYLASLSIEACLTNERGRPTGGR